MEASSAAGAQGKCGPGGVLSLNQTVVEDLSARFGITLKPLSVLGAEV